MMSALTVRRCIQARSVWKKVNYPIYIPEEDSDTAVLLVSGDTRNLSAELKRRATLGSASAAAVLGYLEFMGAFGTEPDLDAAIACCTGPAKAGYPYAQYVLSWAYWEKRNRTEAMRWMKRSTAKSFLPALVDSGRMLAALAGNRGEVRAAVRILWGAHRLGHAGALLLIGGLALRGVMGPLPRLLGLVLFPFAAIRLAVAWRCEPFAARCFAIDKHPEVPFFKP
jgi:TPR repeat protein